MTLRSSPIDPYVFVHDDTDEFAGYVVPLKRGGRFILYRSLIGPNLKIAVIKSIDEAIPTLTAYYEAHPPRWKRTRVTRYTSTYEYVNRAYDKWTFYGVLSVERKEPGRWVAYRGMDPLVNNEGVAIFATPEEAQRAVDLHMCDGFRNSQPINDGLYWKDTSERRAA
jgi:hypothetical protein